MRVCLQRKKIAYGAHDDAVHQHGGSEGGEFGRESVHVRLRV
jgi:hypothetical protein